MGLCSLTPAAYGQFLGNHVNMGGPAEHQTSCNSLRSSDAQLA